MEQGIWIEGDDGQPQFVLYSELDDDTLPQLWRPIGGFCYEAEQFTRIRLAEAPFYLKNLLPKYGRLEIFGQAKAGKSYMAIQLARCIGAGEEFLGIPTSQGRVLYLQFELGVEVLQARMKSTGKSYPDVFIGTTFSMKLDTLVGQQHLQQAVDAVKPEVLILDPFFKTLQGDENECHDVRVVLDFLDTIIEGHRCSVIIFHHPGKDITRGGRGSSVLEDWVDSYVELRRTSADTETLKIKLTPKLLRHAELPPTPTEGVLSDFEFSLVTEARRTVCELVEDYFQLAPGAVIAQEILEAGIGSRRSVYDAIRKLANLGRICREGHSYRWVGGENLTNGGDDVV